MTAAGGGGGMSPGEFRCGRAGASSSSSQTADTLRLLEEGGMLLLCSGSERSAERGGSDGARQYKAERGAVRAADGGSVARPTSRGGRPLRGEQQRQQR